jgi:hypothetical protein
MTNLQDSFRDDTATKRARCLVTNDSITFQNLAKRQQRLSDESCGMNISTKRYDLPPPGPKRGRFRTSKQYTSEKIIGLIIFAEIATSTIET